MIDMNGKGKAYIMFKAGSQYYALRVDQINRVVGVGRDGIQDGCFDLDGKQVQVVDLNRCEGESGLEGVSGQGLDGLNIAVCEVNQQRLGVSLGTLWDCQDMRIKSVPEPRRQAVVKGKPFIAGLIQDEEDDVMVLDLEKMVPGPSEAATRYRPAPLRTLSEAGPAQPE